MRDVRYLVSAGTPMRFFLAVIVSLYFGEMLVMLLIDALPPLSKWDTVLLDSTLLLILVFPTIYFLVFRPLTIHITERKQAEETLQESEERLRLSLQAANQGLYDLNVQTGAAIVNREYAQMLGYDPETFIETNALWIERLHPDDHEITAKAYSDYVNGLTSEYRIEFRQKTIDGHWKWILSLGKIVEYDADGKPLRMLGTHTDITERKRAEEALQTLFSRQEAILDAVTDIIMEVDSNKIYSWANQAGFEFFGEDVLGKEAAFYFEGEQDTYATVQPLFYGSENLFYVESWQRRKDGQKRLLAWWCHVLKDGNGNVTGALSSGRDITERKRAEEEKLELERRLLHSQKLESLGVLAGGIAHDFNNLLAAIIGNLSMVTDDLPELPSVREAVEQAMLAADKAADLTKQMLAYSGRGHLLVKELDLNKLVQENAQLLRAVVPNTVTLNLQLGQELPKILVDASQIQQVVMNLLTNASEAIGDQVGAITVLTGIDSCDETYLSRSRTLQKPEAGMFVWIEVRDTGCGMDEETQHRLFEPFFTTKFTGRGLGMSAVLGIIQGHGGAFIIDSQVGKGTKMRVLFPAAQKKEDSASEDQIIMPAAKSDFVQVRLSGTILVVDDEEMVRVLCVAILRRLGFRVLQAIDGEEALRIFQDQATEISAVILDLTMPLMDGATAFKRMLQIRPDVKVILSSGYSEQDAIKGFSGQYPAGFLQKPYELKTLQAEIERVLRKSGTISAPSCPMPR